MFTLNDKRSKTKQARLVITIPVDVKHSLDRVTKTYRQPNRQVVIRKMLSYCLQDLKAGSTTTAKRQYTKKSKYWKNKETR